MEDKILKMFFEPRRWEEALSKGVVKDMNHQVLRRLMSPHGRLELLSKILAGEYHIERPHTAKIPKDTPGEFRTVFVNKDDDRVFLSLVNDLLFEIAADMVHPCCQSYQKGIGCSKIVSEISREISKHDPGEHSQLGWKADLSKYFDNVPIRYIDQAFDTIEDRFGKSAIIGIVREYYHNDLYYDSELKKEVVHYQSLKQGCAVASWLADVVLYHIDERLSKFPGIYVRYSDDLMFIGPDHKKAMEILEEELLKMEMKLNPKKVESVHNDRWVKFLGYSIKGSEISLSAHRIKTFVKEVKSRTLDQIRHGIKFNKALHSVQSWLYYGDGRFSWATGVLKTINVQSDINRLNGFVMDCLRAVKVGKSVGMNDIGGLGWVRESKDGCISRGKGRKVRSLLSKTDNRLEGYYSLGCMRNNLLYGRDLYESIVRDL